jgi:hypothetical protein
MLTSVSFSADDHYSFLRTNLCPFYSFGAHAWLLTNGLHQLAPQDWPVPSHDLGVLEKFTQSNDTMRYLLICVAIRLKQKGRVHNQLSCLGRGR